MIDQAAIAKRFVALSFCRADMLFEVDDRHNIIFAAGTTDELFGKSAEDLNGAPFTDIVADADRQMVNDLFVSAGDEGRFEDVGIRLPLKGSGAVHAWMSGYRVAELHNNFFLAVKVQPQNKVPKAPLEDHRDHESGTLNEGSFRGAATERIKSIADAGGDPKLTMVTVNNLGKAGDVMSEHDHKEMVGAIGSILNDHSSGANTAGRFDDDHFGIVHSGDLDESAMNERIEAAARELGPDGMEISSQSQTVDADIGGLSEDQVAKAIGFTIAACTDNQSLAPGSGLNAIFETMMAENMRDIEIFRKVCATRDFDLHFMPICDLKSGAVHHLEALTRFRGKIGGGSPYRMITLAEEVGFVDEFDLAVARKAIDTVKKHAVTGNIPPIAINVSGHSISDARFVQNLREMLRAATNLSQMISLEITESAQITDFEGVNANIQEFRNRNFKVALDDFGAGAASFDYLNSFDIDAVKFDGPVVKRACRTAKGKAFLTSMATLCESMQIETIAEMVEDEPMVKFLEECGIGLGQGWHFGKPGSDPSAFRRGKS